MPTVSVHPLPSKSPRDQVWDTLTEHFGNPRTKTERGMFGRVCAELLEAGATAEETDIACRYVIGAFDSPSVNAVPKWFSAAINGRKRPASSPSGKVCPDCGIVVQPPNTLASHLELQHQRQT